MQKKNDSFAETQTKQKDSKEWEHSEAGMLQDWRRKKESEKEMLILYCKVPPRQEE